MSVWNGPSTIRLAFLLLVLGVPITGSLVRRQLATGCAFDGARIDPLLKVRIADARGGSLDFCCIQCAIWWLDRQTDQPSEVFVTDEVTAAEFPAGSAHFVRSSVITRETTGNRIHAFQRLGDAKRHAEVARGRILSGPDRPFHTATDKP